MTGAVEAWQQAELDATRVQRLARALVRLDRLDEAEVALETVPPDARGAEGQLVEGLLHLHRGAPEAALAAFEAGLLLDELPELWVNRCLLGAGARPEALGWCREATQRAPEDPRAQLGLAASALSLGAPDVALAALDRAAPLVEDDVELRAWSAQLRAGAGDPVGACDEGARAGVVSIEVAACCVEAGRPDDAEGALRGLGGAEAAALRLRLAVDRAEGAPPGGPRAPLIAAAERLAADPALPATPAALTDQGRLAMLQGASAEAEALWRRALAEDPTLSAPRLNLANALAARGLLPEALAALEGDAPEILAERGRILEASGQLPEARAVTEAALTGCLEAGHDPCVAELSWRLAHLDARGGDRAALAAHLTRAVAAGGAPLADRVRSDPTFQPWVHDPEISGILIGAR